MIVYDICYRDEAFDKEKGYMSPVSEKFRDGRKHFEIKLRQLNEWEFMIDRQTQKEEYEDCVRCIRDLRLRIWIEEIPFLVKYNSSFAYYTPSNERWTLRQMLYTQGKNETLYASKRESPSGDIRYFYKESESLEKGAIHNIYKEIPHEDFLGRLRK